MKTRLRTGGFGEKTRLRTGGFMQAAWRSFFAGSVTRPRPFANFRRFAIEPAPVFSSQWHGDSAQRPRFCCASRPTSNTMSNQLSRSGARSAHCTRTRRALARIARPLFWTLLFGAIHASTTAGTDEPNLVPDFGTTSITLEVGRPQVICFVVNRATPEQQSFTLFVDPADALQIIDPPHVPAGRTLGMLRVLPLRATSASLRLRDATLHVESRSSDDAADRDAVLTISTPAEGAVVWGKFSVGVDWSQPDAATAATLRLHAQGRSFEPREITPPSAGPFRRAWLEIDANDLRPGPTQLLVEAAIGDAKPLTASVFVTIVPDDNLVVRREAETLYKGPRPKDHDERDPSVSRGLFASGGAYVNHAGSVPRTYAPLTAETAGWYQLIVRAGGDAAGGALPSIAVYVDSQPPATAGRLAAESWHRAAIGVPFRLDAGDHVIVPFFSNDFYVPGKADRNLRLDVIELRRVFDRDLEPAAGESMTMMANAVAMQPDPPTHVAAMAERGGGMTMMRMAAAESAGSSMASAAADCWMADGQRGEVPRARPDFDGSRRSALRVAAARAFDGAAVFSEQQIAAVCSWPNMNDAQSIPPRVMLLLNGEPVASQISWNAVFPLAPAMLRPGENRIQLVARASDGMRAESPPDSLTRAAPPDAPTAAPLLFRFTAYEPGWENLPAIRAYEKDTPERRALRLRPNDEISLALDEVPAGEYEIIVEARAPKPNVGLTMRAALVDGAGNRPIGEWSPVNWWRPESVGSIAFADGEKRLKLALDADDVAPEGESLDVLVQAVTLRRPAALADDTPPQVTLRYPAAGQTMNGCDAAVVEIADDVAARWAVPLIEGRIAGPRVDLANRAGLVLLPLLLREIDPGDHKLTIRVADAAGRLGLSDARVIRISPDPQPAGPFARAVRLLDRLALGADARELAALLTLGEEPYLRDRFAQGWTTAGQRAALAKAVARFPADDPYQASARLAQLCLSSPNPVMTRLLLWVDNHFSTFGPKSGGDNEWRELLAFARIGAGRFDRLLLASAQSPAMLRYLDQVQSFAGRLNENYAREIMELHTLGVTGGYAQEDVTSLARLLTGWTAAEQADVFGAGGRIAGDFRFDPRVNDDGDIRLIGFEFPPTPAEGRYDRLHRALELLCAHPSTARFVCTKLARHYLGPEPPAELIDDLTRVFQSTGGNLAEVLVTLALHPRFQDAPPRLAHPLDFAARLLRCGGADHPWAMHDYLHKVGHAPLFCPTPDGYSETDARAADSNQILARWRFANDVRGELARAVPDDWRWTDRPIGPREAQRIVDLAATRLLGRLLGADSNAAAVALLTETEGKRDERIVQTIAFLAMTPEANER